MSKHLLEALTAFSHMSLVQSVDCSTCEPFRGTLNIHVMDKDEDGKPANFVLSRYVKVSDSMGNAQMHEIEMRDGEGHLTLSNLEAVQLVVVQVDEKGNQIINGDEFHVRYEINGELTQEDYASHTFHQGNQEQTLCIENQKMMQTTLTITKVLLDPFHEWMEFEESMNFCIHVEGMGICKTIDLNMRNHFQTTCKLPVGTYTIWEEEDECYQTRYALDAHKPNRCNEFVLENREHILQVMNQKRSQSVLTLDKYIRTSNQELVKPQDDACFQIRILGDYVDEIIELTCENDFALDVCDLPNGYYDIQEMHADCYDVSYLVNAEKECSYAHVEIRECQSASVVIINSIDTCCNQNSPLRICKYIRRSDGCLVKPDPCLCFKVMLIGCGSCETFNLNASNNFCVDIEHICCGEYEVKEVDACDYVASYIVNDHCETTRACFCIHEGMQNCVQIINEERNQGEVTICKVIKDAHGDYVKPDKSQRFLVTLRSYFCRETFVLDASNDFCVHVGNLREGSYEVKERRCAGFDTTYRINQEEECKKARFLVSNGCCSDIKIINSKCVEISGSLRICKYIANDFGDYVKPAADEEFEVLVQGPCMDTCYYLRAANNWCIILEGLKKGVYRIMEQNACDYTTQYFVNGCESEDALVCLEACNQEVQIVNTRRSYGNLKLSAMVQTCDDCLMKPRTSEHFEILIESVCDTRCITLDASNNFCVLLEDMEKGRYRITQKDNYGYRVLYDIDGEIGSSALVHMEGCNVSVNVINKMMNCSGVLRVRKWVETLDGRIVAPSDEDAYTFCLTSRCLKNEYTLSRRNDFCVFFDDLEEDNYEIFEVQEGMETYYRINQEICDCGRFTLGREDIEVDIINKVLPLPTLCVHKRIMEHGQLIKPEPCESFEFIIQGRDFHEVYCLCEENDWCVCIEGLCNQHYEIKEIGVNCHVTYQIEDQCCKEGYFLFEQRDMEIVIINQEIYEPVVSIHKWIEDEDGHRVRPCRDECFEIILEKENYKQSFMLHEENDWCVQLEGLACGCYFVRERGCGYQAEIFIDENFQEDGSFELHECDVRIDIVNHAGCANALNLYAYDFIDGEELTPSKDKCYLVEVHFDHQKEVFQLDCENDWCLSLVDIQPGNYRIYVKDNPNIIYDVDGECFENAVDVHVQCGDQLVKLLDVTCPKRDITIQRRVKNQHGTLCEPAQDACYEVVLRGECEECFVLDCNNHWCVTLEDMPMGIYEVKELYASKEIRYQMDMTTPCERGYFTLENTPICICIFDAQDLMEQQGTLHFTAMVKNCDGDLETPMQDACFEVMLDGDEIREDFILQAQNNFQISCKHLPFGEYQIQQTPQVGYNRVMYRILGVEQANGTFTFDKDRQQIDIINYRNCARNSIRIMKYIKDASCGCLKRPMKEDTYTIMLEGDSFQQSVILNEANKWCYVFDELLDGEYRVRELGDNDVTYIVNGGKEMSSAIVQLCGKDANVKVINMAKEDKKGAIEISKVMRDENGYDVQPNEQDQFWIHIDSEDVHHRVLLHSANHFIAEVRGLEDGVYEVSEEDGQGVMYRVNGGKEKDRAIVQVAKNMNQVSVINRLHSKGEITLRKRVQGPSGSMTDPTGNESYRIHVSKPGFNTIVTLQATNAFTATLRDLENGMYVVDELDHDAVTYIINGGNQVDRAIVDVNHNQNDVQIINKMDMNKGSIRLIKFIRTQTGQLMRPTTTSSYQFQISKPGFQELITLNFENDWTLDLNDLEDGNYVINEIAGGDQVSYIINDGSETDFGIVSVKGNANKVQIINAQGNHNEGSILVTKRIRDVAGNLIPPTNNFTYSFYISKPNYREIYTLNANNDWGVLISNLEDGDYVISEVANDAKVTYIVNGESEKDRAVVPVRGDENDVVIINAKPNHQGGSITVTKYIRDEESQDLIKPDGDFAVRVQLLRTGYNEVITLDFTNNWTYTFSNLIEGDYVLNEINSPYGTSWIIDGQPEVRYALIRVANDDHQADMINTIRRGSGSITIKKYVRSMDGTLVTPPNEAQYLFYISKPSFSQAVILTARNNFSVTLPNLEDGNYLINEAAGETNVSYRINGGSETNFGVVNVVANDNLVEAINASRPSGNGSITITKYIRDASGTLVRPTGLFQTRVHVSKPGFNDVFTLNALNDWTVLLTDMMDGEYVLSEVDSEDEVTWIINGGSEVRFATVAVAQNDNQVDMIDTPRNDTGTILLSKYIRTATGQLVRPRPEEVFMVQVVGPQSRFITLDVNNQWNARVSGLPQGSYEVREISNNNYEISYIVNDGVESANATVMIDQDEVSVGILNSPIGSRSVLEIRKYIKNADGTLETPADGDSYQIEIRGNNTQQVIELNEENNFSSRISNLAEGMYTISELAVPGIRVSYRVNGGSETSTAQIQAGAGISNLVEVLNERSENRNTLDVFKFILDANGNFQKPTNNQVFRFLLSGTNFQQYFTLSSANDWHVFIDTLDSGMYEVIEQSNRLYDVSYLVNGGEFQKEGTFQAAPGSQNIVEIINQPVRSEKASLMLEKKIRTLEGDLVIPGNQEVFQIRLTNLQTNASQTYPLNEANGYLYTVQDLDFGQYQVEEISQANYRTSYIVNEGDEQASARVNLQTMDTQNVMIINTVQEMVVNARRSSDIKIILE